MEKNENQTQLERLLTPPQVASILAVSVHTLTTWRKAGIGPQWFKLTDQKGASGAATLRMYESELRAWIESKRLPE